MRPWVRMSRSHPKTRPRILCLSCAHPIFLSPKFRYRHPFKGILATRLELLRIVGQSQTPVPPNPNSFFGLKIWTVGKWIMFSPWQTTHTSRTDMWQITKGPMISYFHPGLWASMTTRPDTIFPTLLSTQPLIVSRHTIHTCHYPPTCPVMLKLVRAPSIWQWRQMMGLTLPLDPSQMTTPETTTTLILADHLPSLWIVPFFLHNPSQSSGLSVSTCNGIDSRTSLNALAMPVLSSVFILFAYLSCIFGLILQSVVCMTSTYVHPAGGLLSNNNLIMFSWFSAQETIT